MVADVYRIEGELGRGAMGVVYRALHTNLDREVALKELLSRDPDNTKRVLREAMAMARVDHPNVVRVFDAREVDGGLIIAMEYVEGMTLGAWCAAKRRTVPELLQVFIGAAQGLAAAHARGLVHRDFKPDNVLIAEDGTPKVADFGIARAVDTPGPVSGPADRTPFDNARSLEIEVTRTGELIGTPAYMAPEQYEGGATAQSDQFAWCVACYEALYGRRPFEGSTIAELWMAVSSGEVPPPPVDSDVPDAVFEALRRGLSTEPERRFPTMNSLVRALQRADRSTPWAWLAVLPVVLLVAGIAMVLVNGSEDPVATPVRAGLPSLVVGWSRPEFAMQLRPLPMIPIQTQWPPTESLICADQVLRYRGIEIRREGKPAIVARAGCDLRCDDCTLEGMSIVVAKGDAKVRLQGGHITGTRMIAVVDDTASLTVEGPNEIDATQTKTAFAVRDDARLQLKDVEFEADIGVFAFDRAVVNLDDVRIVAKTMAIQSKPDTTVRQRAAIFDGPTKLGGRVQPLR
jgi:hypothetical protein